MVLALWFKTMVSGRLIPLIYLKRARRLFVEAALDTVVGRLPLINSIIKIGSAPDNQLVLHGPKASSFHAGIRLVHDSSYNRKIEAIKS